MRLLYSSDLHGEIRLYEELLKRAAVSSAEIIALGGDLFPSIPATKNYEQMIPNQVRFIDQFLMPFFERTLEASSVKRILLISGNWDLAYPHLFNEPLEGLIDLNEEKHLLENGYELIGYPYVPPSPFRPKDYEKMDDPDSPWPDQKSPSYIRAPEKMDRLIPVDPYGYLKQKGTIRDDLGRLPKSIHPERTIYVMHSPPFGTQLDRIQGGRFAGSRSIRTFIEEQQPLLTLHGHIHESAAISGTSVDRIGETISVNPGQSFWTGRESATLDAVTFEVERPAETMTHRE